MADPRVLVTGVLLAGGRAERMDGRDKGLLPLAGEPLIVHGVRRLKPQVAELLISANRHGEIYQRFGCRVVGDSVNERFRGPLAGMLAALRAATTPWVLTAPCDSPLLPPDYAARMLAALAEGQSAAGVMDDAGRWQPVFVLLSVDLRVDLTAWLAAGEGGAERWLRRHRPVPVKFPDWPGLWRNVNTPEELARLEAEWPGLDSAT
ncbi:MAG: molybdenum cofactor guanylyltransferase MobA [Candidatus Contendobacter sp.]|nr:molybdenum cofactor guanylyltransferase MobA [Candidatus Contendobacter sp.]MDG4558699.1 molybdenum cofactor guanylyltransferase MobA [Candidatus Contendobacter sp.]